jgi:hypothetical protein
MLKLEGTVIAYFKISLYLPGATPDSQPQHALINPQSVSYRVHKFLIMLIPTKILCGTEYNLRMGV